MTSDSCWLQPARDLLCKIVLYNLKLFSTSHFIATFPASWSNQPTVNQPINQPANQQSTNSQPTVNQPANCSQPSTVCQSQSVSLTIYYRLPLAENNVHTDVTVQEEDVAMFCRVIDANVLQL